jgi:hypothetical protein
MCACMTARVFFPCWIFKLKYRIMFDIQGTSSSPIGHERLLIDRSLYILRSEGQNSNMKEEAEAVIEQMEITFANV